MPTDLCVASAEVDSDAAGVTSRRSCQGKTLLEKGSQIECCKLKTEDK